MIIKTDKETRDRMCWLLRKEIADYAVHGAKNWLGTSINRELWEMTIKDTEDLICIHNLIKDNEISLAFESASGLETAVRDEIPTEVWNWMSNVWAGNDKELPRPLNYVEPGPVYKEPSDEFLNLLEYSFNDFPTFANWVVSINVSSLFSNEVSNVSLSFGGDIGG